MISTEVSLSRVVLENSKSSEKFHSPRQTKINEYNNQKITSKERVVGKELFNKEKSLDWNWKSSNTSQKLTSNDVKDVNLFSDVVYSLFTIVTDNYNEPTADRAFAASGFLFIVFAIIMPCHLCAESKL